MSKTPPPSSRSGKSAGAKSNATPPVPSTEELYRQYRSQVLLRTGISFFAVLAGLACYYGVLQLRFNQTVAAIAGLIFALLVWIAARSLFRDLLLAIARSRASETNTERQLHAERQAPAEQDQPTQRERR